MVCWFATTISSANPQSPEGLNIQPAYCWALAAQGCGHYSNGSATLVDIAKYWDGLKLFLTDGRIEIDNKSVERHPAIALNREHALDGSRYICRERVANASLTETCELNGVDALAYLTATLTAIVNGH